MYESNEKKIIFTDNGTEVYQNKNTCHTWISVGAVAGQHSDFGGGALYISRLNESDSAPKTIESWASGQTKIFSAPQGSIWQFDLIGSTSPDLHIVCNTVWHSGGNH